MAVCSGCDFILEVEPGNTRWRKVMHHYVSFGIPVISL